MILTFAVSIFAATGTTYAQTTTREVNSYPFISAIPKNANVGENVLINFGLLNGLNQQIDGWNVTAVITDPDGVVTRIDGMTWSTGTVGKSFTPTKEGEYKLVCEFERVFYAGRNEANGWYKASKSDTFIMYVTVGEGKSDYPGHALPTEYWTRPIDGQLREWYTISGSWLRMTLNRVVTNQEPVLSPHVLWTMPIGDTNGGLAGGDFAFGFQDGDAYEGHWYGPIIICGILYYNKISTGMSSSSYRLDTQQIVAVDIHTGEKLWERNYEFGASRFVFGQLLSWFSYNNRGAWAYLWMSSGTNMYALEAFTGNLIWNITNVPSTSVAGWSSVYDRFFYGPNGELLQYMYVNTGTAASPNYELRQWNSSFLVAPRDPEVSWGSAVANRQFNGANGYDWNITLGNAGIYGGIIAVFPCDKVIFGPVKLAQYSSAARDGNITLSAVNIDETSSSFGQIIYKNVGWTAPDSFNDIRSEGYVQSDWTAVSPDVLVFWEKFTRINYGFNANTGQYMWKTEPQSYECAWAAGALSITSGCQSVASIMDDKLVVATVGGGVYCYDITTGKLNWQYEALDEYKESYTSESWWLCITFGVNGIAYFGVQEHSTLEPKPRGAPFFALDLETGDLVWEIKGMFRQTQWGGHAIMGDSIIVTQDSYDQQIYAVGKGPTSLTLTAPSVAVTSGTPVLIKGTIMDVSPGAVTDKMKLRFAQGVPAIRDDDMSDWMLYVYKNFEYKDFIGVPITLGVVDAEGGYSEYTTVSDATGKFAVEIETPTSGQYTIYAYFDGTNSYYGDWAQESMLVAEAPAESHLLTYGLYVVGIVILLAVLLFGLWIKKK